MPLPQCNPFNPGDHATYRRWRERKLARYRTDASALNTRIAEPGNISASERQSLQAACNGNNFCFYHSDAAMSRGDVLELGSCMGLDHVVSNLYADDQGISEVRVSQGRRQQKFIPYTDRSLNWHTDGYYQSAGDGDNMDGRIQSFILHCVESAPDGGENHLLDHEIAYILLRDQNPDYIAALMHPEAMTIPANQTDNQNIRQSVTGPVFTVTASGRLWMRYTARTRSVLWRPDPVLSETRAALTDLLENSDYVIRHTLSPGEGLICNNILHNRTSFRQCEQQSRLLYRVRYLDRIDVQLPTTPGHPDHPDHPDHRNATQNQI